MLYKVSSQLALSDMLDVDPRRLAAAAASLYILFCLCKRLYCSFLGPLSSVPGPLACRLTGLIDLRESIVGGRRAEWIHSLHEKYGEPRQQLESNRFRIPLSLIRSYYASTCTCTFTGPIVRISPNLCAVADPNEMKIVYGGKLAKSRKRYEGKRMDGVDHALVLLDAKAAKARRGIILPLFQKDNLRAFESSLHHYTEQVLDQLDREQHQQGHADVFRWFRLVAFDIIGLWQCEARRE